jgi:hypothetical protein
MRFKFQTGSQLCNLQDDVDINRSWKIIRDNLEISVNDSLDCYELEEHEPRFDEGCSKLFNQR